MFILLGATLLEYAYGVLQGIWGSRARFPGELAGKGGGFGRGGSGKAAGFFGQGGVASAMGGTRIIGPTGRDQVGNGAKGSGKGGGDTGAGVGGLFLSEVVGGNGGEAVCRSGGTWPVPPGPVLSQRDQAVSALRALVGLLDPAVGAQVRRLVEGFLLPKPAAPATPTHAQIVARLHGLYDSETKLIQKVDEVEGRVEKAKAKVVEEEAALAGVQGELQGVKDQIMATLMEEADCRERTRKEGTDSDVMEDGVNVEEDGSSEEVGAEMDMGKKRKVLRRERFSRRGGAVGKQVNLEEVIRILKGLSKEERGRCMRSAEIDEELSSLSDANSGGAAAEGSNFTSATVLTPCG